MNNTSTSYIEVPLTTEAHEIALRFAAEQLTVATGKKIYLNTLAVYAVHYYLEWSGIETNLNSGDSWHPALRCLFDTADLVVSKVGKLECRIIEPGEIEIDLPSEVVQNRAGYIVVQFNEYFNQVQLVGFIRASALANPDQILIAALESTDSLVPYLRNYLILEESELSFPPTAVRLPQWLSNIFEDGWQPMSSLLATDLAFDTRNTDLILVDDFMVQAASVNGGKLIDLGIEIYQHPVALILRFTPISAQQVNVLVQVLPTRGQRILPQHLRLTVSDETGENSRDAFARKTDNWIRLEFDGEPGERFSVEIALGEASVTEYFLI